ncbi:MAG: alpha/beta hydrolase fold domain-containing protein, partial [Acidiferrobacterales bacterium]
MATDDMLDLCIVDIVHTSPIWYTPWGEQTMTRVLLAAMTAALLSSPALAQDSDWTIGSRTLPAPAGASDALRAAIANTPQPDVTKHIRNTTFTTREEWVRSIRAANAGNTQRAEALAERRSVTITEYKIAGVTVRTVTPADVDPANENRLFVHLHGGAYVANGGSAGLREAILIANWAKIAVMSIDYRMPPKHPFPAAV